MAKKTEEFIEEPKEVEPKAKKSITGLYDKETYLIKIPLSQEKQDDVTVGINGELTKIQRGVEVEVSAAVYEVLQNMERMDQLAFERRKKLMSN